MPDELRLQFPKAKEVLDALGIKHFEIDNYEADDIIGTLSLEVEKRDDFVATIISSDKDLLQLVSDKVVMKLLKQNGHIMMTESEFEKTYQVPPIRMIDLKALMGDPSDHIPGVKGIGEKTAINLLSQFQTLDNLYNHLDEVKGKAKEKLENDKKSAYMSYDLATIYREVPLDFTLDDCKYTRENTEAFRKLLEEFEFHSLLKKYSLVSDTIQEEKKAEESISILPIDKLIANTFAFYVETKGSVYSKSEVLGVGIYDGISGYFLSKEELENHKELFSGNSFKYTYDYKKDIVVLHSLGIDVCHVTFDTMIAAYLLDYVVKDDISYVAQSFDVKLPLYDDLFGTEKRPKEVSDDVLRDVCCRKAKFIFDTRNQLLEELQKNDELELFQKIEMPLSRVLADMEITGIKVDVSYLDKVADELKEQMDILEKEIYECAGVTFNIMSPAQLSKVLFETLKIPYPKRVKDGKYSTSKDILDKIRFVHPIVDKILEYRTLAKLYTNYAVGLKEEVREDGRIHTIFTQTLTRTGRLSSISPNLQNIPARKEYSKLIRKAFIPDENSKLLSSDYSQVELRVFAHMSGAENLIQAFKDGKDIHTKTASDIYRVPMEEVTKDMRRTAKAVNFGILYGISSFGLSEDLGIDISTAKKFIDNYLETFPGISEYMEEEKRKAHELGYVTTLMHRRRVIPELKNKNYMIRSSGERMALNTPIQGTAADILKKAMVEIYDEFEKRGLKSKMLIQVHDELVFNVLDFELEEVSSIVRDIMEHTIELSVPLKVDIEYGNNWYEAK